MSVFYFTCNHTLSSITGYAFGHVCLCVHLFSSRSNSFVCQGHRVKVKVTGAEKISCEHASAERQFRLLTYLQEACEIRDRAQLMHCNETIDTLITEKDTHQEMRDPNVTLTPYVTLHLY